MLYPEELIAEIRDKNDIVDVISTNVNLKQRGSTYVGLCPFHNEKTPSFSVSRDKQIYHCFGCGAGGNVITYIMEYENFSFVESIKFLAERSGIHLPEAEMTPEMKARAKHKESIYEANKEAARYFYGCFNQEIGKHAEKYLNNRGVENEIRKRFAIGYASMFKDDCYQYLKSKQFSDKVLEDSGLIAKDKNGEVRDNFWNRLMFPILDIHGRVIGFGGRVLGDGEPKYLNTRETEIFDKSKNLYGMNLARRSKKGYIILVEGYMDVVAMHQAGFDNAVASLGTSLTEGQAKLIKRYTDQVVIAYDADNAGVNAALRATSILKNENMQVKVLKITEAKDPDEYIKNHGSEKFEELLKTAMNGILFEIELEERKFRLQDPDEKTKFIGEVAKIIAKIDSDLERDNYIDHVALKYRVDTKKLTNLINQIGSQLNQMQVQKLNQTKRKVLEEDDAIRLAQKNILTLIYNYPETRKALLHYLSLEEFTHESYRQCAKVMIEKIRHNETIEPAKILDGLSEPADIKEMTEIFFKAPVLEDNQIKERFLNDSLKSLKLHYINKASMETTDLIHLQNLVKMKKDLQNLNIKLVF